MLESTNSDVRVHAFHILYNLWIFLSKKKDCKTDDLIEKFCEMSQYLLFAEETDEKVWNASLTCLLQFVMNESLQRFKFTKNWLIL